jgi:subtilisin family serine protease
LNAGFVRTFDYPSLGVITRVLVVAPADIAKTEAALRAQSGVRSVALAGARRLPLTVSQPYFTNDPYFNGFATTVPPTTGATAPPSTYHVAPYEQSASVPGQWEMHAIMLEHAFAYSQANNGSTVSNANALGSSAIKIAVIDTGADSTHPELTSKVAYQRCFITNPSNVQSTSDFAPDPQGHGTDVSGLAAAATGNAFGFAGAGGNAVLYTYRVFPEPDDSCASDSTSSASAQCGASPLDLASAINDAVAQKVNVISISLGSGGCTNGVDDDATEDQALTTALAQNIVVAAAAGNDGLGSIDAPACKSGVIAVGASALDDGQPNGTNSGLGTPTTPKEYIAGYSNFGSPGATVHSASAWGIVAPGGDPQNCSSCTDLDDLHWISDIWTSLPFQTDPSDNSYTGDCTDDYPSSATTAPVDCRIFIAGTSMATPLVAGAAALILAVNNTYASPAKMKQLLCATADDIQAADEGCGRLNVYRAMATALADPHLP